MESIKIQLSKVRIVPGHTTVWQDAGADVDITMDLKALTFRPGSVESIVAFHVLDHMFDNEVEQALKNWHSCLMPGGTLTVVVDDFEYIARAIVAADISLDIFNRQHSHAMQFSQESLSKYLTSAGFKPEDQRVWFAPIPNFCPKEHYEVLIAAKK